MGHGSSDKNARIAFEYTINSWNLPSIIFCVIMSIAIEVVRRGRKNHCYIHLDGFQKMESCY